MRDIPSPGGWHPPHQIYARDSAAKELLVLPFSLVRKRKKQEPHWEPRRILLPAPSHTLAEVALHACKISPRAIATSAVTGGSENPCEHHQRSNHSRSRIFFEMTLFLMLLSSNT